MMDFSFFEIIKSILLFLICFCIIIYLINTCFFPFYKNVLREKIREWIVQSRLDISGKQIQKNMVNPDKYLLMFQSIEKLFGLDHKPLISVTESESESPSKCIFAS